MASRITIADVAELAGVDKATVSRALNVATEQYVSATTAKRIRRAAEQLGYVPNAMARGLRTNTSMTIGVVVPDLRNPIFPPMLRGIEHVLSARGYTALIANTDERDSLERTSIESLLDRQVDGLIIATARIHYPLLDLAVARGVQCVMLNRGADEVSYPLVTGDDASGISAAVSHLHELGHRRIVHIAGPAYLSTARLRAATFLSACSSQGIAASVVHADALTADAAAEAMKSISLDESSRPTAMLASNDLLALGALRWLKAQGLSCPRDMSIVGFNDMPFAEDFTPPLTTISVPFWEMGGEAARVLLEGIAAGEQRPMTISLPVKLVVRESTSRPAFA